VREECEYFVDIILHLCKCKDMKSNERKRKELEDRKQTVVASLPPFTEMVRGSLFERLIKCGKASCRCAQGKGHPTTYLSVSFKGGKTVQITVPKKLVSRVRKWVENYSASFPDALGSLAKDVLNQAANQVADRIAKDQDVSEFPDILVFEEWTEKLTRDLARAMMAQFVHIRSRQAKETLMKCLG